MRKKIGNLVIKGFHTLREALKRQKKSKPKKNQNKGIIDDKKVTYPKEVKPKQHNVSKQPAQKAKSKEPTTEKAKKPQQVSKAMKEAESNNKWRNMINQERAKTKDKGISR